MTDLMAVLGGSHAAQASSTDSAQTDVFDDLGEYRARVILARESRSVDTIHNSSHPHAAVLIEQLFVAADRQVRILCRNLNAEVYTDPAVVAAALQFLSRPGARLDILHEREIEADHGFVAAVQGHPGVRIARLSSDRTVPFNFMVADDDAYRFEPNSDRANARACFNHPPMARELVGAFSDLQRLAA